MAKKGVPDRFYNGGDFNDIYFRQQQDFNLTSKNRRESGVPLSNTFQQWIDSQPPLPVHAPECKCAICVGNKMCPKCEERTMYLDTKQRVWRCIKCHIYEAVFDTTKQSLDSEPRG